MSKLEEIVVRVTSKHQKGERRRAGFAFTTHPVRIQVTAEQKKMIEDDQYLRIVTKGVALDQAVDATGSGTQSNPDETPSLADEIAALPNKGAVIEKLVEAGLVEGEDFQARDSRKDLEALLLKELSDEGDEDPVDYNAMTVEEIVVALEEKGYKQGEDFEADAEKDALIALLNA